MNLRSKEADMDYRKEVWGYAWKIALSIGLPVTVFFAGPRIYDYCADKKADKRTLNLEREVQSWSDALAQNILAYDSMKNIWIEIPGKSGKYRPDGWIEHQNDLYSENVKIHEELGKANKSFEEWRKAKKFRFYKTGFYRKK